MGIFMAPRCSAAQANSVQFLSCRHHQCRVQSGARRCCGVSVATAALATTMELSHKVSLCKTPLEISTARRRSGARTMVELYSSWPRTPMAVGQRIFCTRLVALLMDQTREPALFSTLKETYTGP